MQVHQTTQSIRAIESKIRIPQYTPPAPISIEQHIRGAIGAGEVAEPGIALDPGPGVHEGGGVLEELHGGGRVVGALVHAELGDPDGQDGAAGGVDERGRDVGRVQRAQVVGALQVRLEVVDVVGAGVPMDVDEIERQVRFLLGRVAEELRQVGQARARVGHGRSADFHPPGERLHEGGVARDGLRDRHVGAHAREGGVGLVEAEDGVGAVVCDAEVDVGGPDGRERVGVVVEQWDEAVRWARVGVGSDVVGGVGEREVVVRPGYVG